ncbi:hypothetical protein MHYP_G00275370 [Metynnis hypsauchen]
MDDGGPGTNHSDHQTTSTRVGSECVQTCRMRSTDTSEAEAPAIEEAAARPSVALTPRLQVTAPPCLEQNGVLDQRTLFQMILQCMEPQTDHQAWIKNQLKELQSKVQQRIQEKQKKLQELKQTVTTLKRCAQSAVEDSERIFTELIRSIEKKGSEVTELIRAQEEAEVSAVEELLEKLEQEIADLNRRRTELEQLSHTEDHIHFLQSFQPLCVSSGSEDSPSITLHQHLSFDGVRRSISELKERLEEFCREEFIKIPTQVGAVQILSSEPKTREDFLQSPPPVPWFQLRPVEEHNRRGTRRSFLFQL